MGKVYDLKDHSKVWNKIKMKKVTIQNLELSFNTECSAEDLESFSKAVLEKVKKIVNVNGVTLEVGRGMVYTLKVELGKK
jgi:hypothetical protein